MMMHIIYPDVRMMHEKCIRTISECDVYGIENNMIYQRAWICMLTRAFQS